MYGASMLGGEGVQVVDSLADDISPEIHGGLLIEVKKIIDEGGIDVGINDWREQR